MDSVFDNDLIHFDVGFYCIIIGAVILLVGSLIPFKGKWDKINNYVLIVIILISILLGAGLIAVSNKKDSTDYKTEDDTVSSIIKEESDSNDSSADGSAEIYEEATQSETSNPNPIKQQSIEKPTFPPEIECPYYYEQKLEVLADGSNADFTLYEWNETNGDWEDIWSAEGYVGSDGVSADNSENNCATPEGIFDIGFCYGLTRPETTLRFVTLNPDSIWVDDPNLDYYNCLTTYGKATDASSYNYTAGCVAIPENDMLHILEWLNENKNPVIIII